LLGVCEGPAMVRRLILFVTILILSLAIPINNTVQFHSITDSCSGWFLVASPTTFTLRAISIVSSTEGWAIGQDGVILHWDGSKWSQVASPIVGAEIDFILGE